MRVPLASYNGAACLDEQLHGDFGQKGVSVSAVASYGASASTAPKRLIEWSARSNLTALPWAKLSSIDSGLHRKAAAIKQNDKAGYICRSLCI